MLGGYLRIINIALVPILILSQSHTDVIETDDARAIFFQPQSDHLPKHIEEPYDPVPIFQRAKVHIDIPGLVRKPYSDPLSRAPQLPPGSFLPVSEQTYAVNFQESTGGVKFGSGGASSGGGGGRGHGGGVRGAGVGPSWGANAGNWQNQNMLGYGAFPGGRIPVGYGRGWGMGLGRGGWRNSGGANSSPAMVPTPTGGGSMAGAGNGGGNVGNAGGGMNRMMQYPPWLQYPYSPYPMRGHQNQMNQTEIDAQIKKSQARYKEIMAQRAEPLGRCQFTYQCKSYYYCVNGYCLGVGAEHRQQPCNLMTGQLCQDDESCVLFSCLPDYHKRQKKNQNGST